MDQKDSLLTYPEDELTELEEIAGAIATHLGNALREIEKMMEEFSNP